MFHGRKLPFGKVHSGLLAVALACASMVSAAQAAGNEKAPAFIEARGGKITKVEKAPGGMTAYTVEKNGNTAVFFVSPDSKVAMIGVMFDAKTGENLSDRMLPANPVPNPAAVVAEAQAKAAAKPQAEGPFVPPPVSPRPAPPKAEMDKVFNDGPLRENMAAINKASSDGKTLSEHLRSDKVPGVLEGRASIKTAFVFFDPRCPYCHNLYDNTRKAAGKGASIKWIPVNTLGDQGLPVSNQLLKDGASALPAWYKNALPGVAPNPIERSRIDMNTALFFMITNKLGEKPATPTILFMNEKSGRLVLAQDDGTAQGLIDNAFKY